MLHFNRIIYNKGRDEGLLPLALSQLSGLTASHPGAAGRYSSGPHGSHH